MRNFSTGRTLKENNKGELTCVYLISLNKIIIFILGYGLGVKNYISTVELQFQFRVREFLFQLYYSFWLRPWKSECIFKEKNTLNNCTNNAI